MADNPLLHPDKDELVAFGLGKLQPDQATKIETHLEECKTCCDTLLDLEDDTFVELVRKSPAPKQSTDEANTVNTMPVESGVSRGPTELPAQLDDHPRYRIIELIGKGGMGDVYKAEHRLMHRPVALKLINQDLVKNKQAVERFRREVRAAARLTHPNIVTAHDAEQAGDVHFLVMEFVNGVDLASEVQNRGSLPIAEACDYIRQAAEGLQHAHTKGMVHRDIKPHNLMLSADGQVRILDFGLASFATESALIGADAKDITEEMPTRLHLTTLGSVMGTPDYIAPEQARDAHSADIRADIYSLGCTLHFLLTGKPVFEADSVVDKLKAHIEQAPPSLDELRCDLPPGLNEVVARLLAKHPDDRFQTPAEVAAALAPFCVGRAFKPVSAPPRRRTLRNVLAAAAAILLAGVIIYVATDTGLVEIDAKGIEAPGAKIVLLNGGREYASFDIAATREVQKIRAGEYEVQLHNVAGNLKMDVWSKRGNTNNWGEPDDHERKPVVLYRGGGLLVRVLRNESANVAALGDLERLQGKWVPISAKFRGKELSAEQLARMAITLTRNRATLTDPNNGEAMPGTFAIDATRSPKHIDFIAPGGKERAPGIFEFDGERLKVAFVDSDYARPTDFEPAQTPDHMTAVFERVPGSAPATVPPDEAAAAPVLDETQREAVKAAEAYLAVMAEGKFGSLRDMVSSMARPHVTREQVSQTYQKLRDTFGKAEERTLHRVQVYDEFPGLPIGRYALVQYNTDFERQKGLWESLLLNIDTDGQWRVNTYANTLEPMPFPEVKQDPVVEKKKQVALSAAQAWLELADAGKYGESWEASAKINRDGVSKQQMIDGYNELFQPLGKLQSRTFKSSEYTTQMPRAPVGEYAVIQFNTQFTNGRIIEAVILMLESDGQWRVAGYRHAEDNSDLAPRPLAPKQTPPPPRAGLLTNPPKLPQGGLPVGKNLIDDPSLEETATGQLPKGWFAWLNDGPDFKCEVVEGGVIGKHCLQISGTGTRGVVFATSIPMDRTKRYALKGRVKVEGESGTWAVIKLNYFNNTGWLGVDDRVGVSTADLDWKLFEKTDAIDKYPSATLIVPTCHIEGNGTAWFDDLEVIAYDRNKLSDNFDANHGKNNRMK